MAFRRAVTTLAAERHPKGGSRRGVVRFDEP
jgi:hypothetical protein